MNDVHLTLTSGQLNLEGAAMIKVKELTIGVLERLVPANAFKIN